MVRSKPVRKTCRVKACGVKLTKRNKSSSGNICHECWAKQQRKFVRTHNNNIEYKARKAEAQRRWLAKIKSDNIEESVNDLWYSQEELGSK